MRILRQYQWEVTHAMIILGVIITLALVTHLKGVQQAPAGGSEMVVPLTPLSRTSTATPHNTDSDQIPTRAKAPSRSTPATYEVIVGPSGINSRYTLISVERRRLSSTVDELTIKLHIASLAAPNLVSPFASDMLEIRSPDLEPIPPRTAFHTPIPAGESQNKDVLFNIPARLRLDRAFLHIHYYNYEKRIPLNLPPHAGSERSG